MSNLSEVHPRPAPPILTRWPWCFGLTAIMAAVSACGNAPSSVADGPGNQVPFADCTLDRRFLLVSVARDAIPSIDDPVWVRANVVVPDYLDPDTRIIGVIAGGLAWAIPHNVLWHHEVVNLDTGGTTGDKLAITYCPLTGSSVVFDRRSVGGATMGVSGLLFKNNLMLFDRRQPEESLWPQMLGAAGCGPRTGTELNRHRFVEMRWSEWVSLHPSTSVLAQDQGFDPVGFDYTSFGYPYGPYRDVEAPFSNAMPPMDRRRFAKERVLGVPSTGADPGIAFPFGALTEKDGSHQVVGFEYAGEAAIVLWSDDAQGGAAFRPATRSGVPVALRATSSGFQDDGTGSRWTLEGLAVSGPLEGEQLVSLDDSYTAFWFGWASFYPDTRLWEG